ncbi:MAG: hypothetical protein ACK5G7_00510 [Erysipelotrichaceae bacterium]
MRKFISILVVLILLVGCSNNKIVSGVYVVDNLNDKPLYLIDIDTGYRIVELKPRVFQIHLAEERLIASFDMAFDNPSTGNSTISKLGFFNSSLQTSDKAVLSATNTSEDAIIIQAEAVLVNNDNIEVGTVLRNFGPVKYYEFDGEYYSFILANNLLKVAADKVLVVEPSDQSDNPGSNWDWEEDIDYAEIAYKYLSVEIAETITDPSIYLVETLNVTVEGLSIINPERNGNINVINMDLLKITFTSVLEGSPQQIVYLSEDSFDIIGFGEIAPEIELNDETENQENDSNIPNQ